MRLAVEFQEGVEPPFLDSWFERIALAAAAAAGDDVSGAEAVLLLADDATLHELNRQYRGMDKPTDVLSFEGETYPPEPVSFSVRPGASPLGTEPVEGPAHPDTRSGRPRHLGDIAISLERARRQADDYGHSFERELAYLLTHGTLHLLGFDHEDDDEQRAMREVEERALASLGLARETSDAPRP